jgi:hypothetical protein
MATIQLKFGTLSLDTTNNITISGISEKNSKPVQTFNIPVTDGAIAETAKIGPKTINIDGDIVGTSYDNLRSNIDALHAGLLGQGLAKLTKDNERYIYCQLKDFSYSYDHLTRRATWSAQFVGHFPFWLSETEYNSITTDASAPRSGVGWNVTNAGNAPTRVKIIANPGPLLSIDDLFKFENTTLGQAFQYRGNIGSTDYLEVDNRYDSDDFQCLLTSVDDIANFEGDFITLTSGVNTVEFTGLESTDIMMYWRSCWY